MSHKYYLKVLTDAIAYRRSLLDVDKSVNSHIKHYCKEALSVMDTRVNHIALSIASDENKTKSLQECILEMNVGQIGLA